MNKLNIILVLSTFLFLSCSNGSVYSELLKNLSVLLMPPSDIPQEEVNSVKYSTKFSSRVSNSSFSPAMSMHLLNIDMK